MLGEAMHQEDDDTRPAGLMTGPDPDTGVSMEVLVYLAAVSCRSSSNQLTMN